VMGSTTAIFDTGSTIITGDPHGISKFFEAIPNARRAQEIGDGFYSSALRDAFT
jgi:hypothetical protein